VTVDEGLADRLERAMADAAVMRGVELQQVVGNPLAIEHRTFDRLQARLVGSDLAYYPYFSGPLGLRSGDIAVVPDLVNWYAQRNAPCYVRLSPLLASADLLRALSVAGLAQTGFMSLLYGTSDRVQAITCDIRVEEIAHDQLGVFLDLWTYAAADGERALRQRLAGAEFSHWRCYVAFVEDQPAAHAALFISSPARIGVLAAAATLPALRGRGCQTALVRRRMSDAALAGCDLVAVEATPGSPSQRNLERAGLRLAYTRVTWSRDYVCSKSQLDSK
jgi:GNAT superfamily N-acetyltransferase